MTTAEQERYLAVIRALVRPVRNGLFLCVATTIVVLVALFLGLNTIIGGVPETWPVPVRVIVVVAISGFAIVVLPSLSQLLIVHGRTAEAIEAFNMFGLAELADYQQKTGSKPPTLRNSGHARKWLSKNQGYGTRFRIRTLIWVGELNAASELIAAMPQRDPTDAFQRSLLRQELEFVATGTMDLDEPAALLATIPSSPTRDEAAVALAFERARLELDRGNDPFAPLAEARAHVARLPRGASIRDRFMVGVQATAVIFAVAAVVGWVGPFR